MRYERRPRASVYIRRGVPGIFWAELIKLNHRSILNDVIRLNGRSNRQLPIALNSDVFWARQTKGRFDRQKRIWNKTIPRNYFGWSKVYRRDALWQNHRTSRHEEHSLRINAVSVVSATFCISFFFYYLRQVLARKPQQRRPITAVP